MKEAESMSIPVIGGGGSWGNNIAGVEEDPMVSHTVYQSFVGKKWRLLHYTLNVWSRGNS